jgi:hypothetical protein
MKLTSTFAVKVEDVTFHFRKPRTNDNIEGLKGVEFRNFIFSRLLRVEGEIEDENGNKIDVLNMGGELGLPVDLVTKIVKAWGEELANMAGVKAVSEEKKSTSNA